MQGFKFIFLTCFVEKARPLAASFNQRARSQPYYREVKGRITLNLAENAKTVGPNIETMEKGIKTGKGSVQYGREKYNGGTKDETSVCNVWSKPQPGNDMEDSLQRRGHAEVHSTVAERQTPQEVETMKLRVSNSSFIHAVHGCSFATTATKFINAEGVCYIVNQLFDGGMIYPNHS